MDKQAKSTFIGVISAVAVIAAIGGVGYGLYYASTAEERRAAAFKEDMRSLKCSVERVRLLNSGKDFDVGHPCYE